MSSAHGIAMQADRRWSMDGPGSALKQITLKRHSTDTGGLMDVDRLARTVPG